MSHQPQDNYTNIAGPQFRQICYNICFQKEKHLYKDLHQETILYILEKKYDITLISLEELPYYFSKCAWFIYRNPTKTGFRNKNVTAHLPITMEPAFQDNIEEKLVEEKCISAVEEKLSQSETTNDQYNNGLFTCYMKYGSGHAVSTMTGIPVRTVYNDLSNYKKELKITYEAANK